MVIGIPKSTHHKTLVTAVAMAMTLFVFSCGDKKAKKADAEPPANIVEPTPRAATFTLLPVQIPNGSGGYKEVGPADFVNGNYNQDVLSGPPPQGFSPKSDELQAMGNSIFPAGPGFLWLSDPPFPVVVTLSARGRSQTVNREPHVNGKLAVSLHAFPDVFPPVYRERYELTIKSAPGAINPFAYTYTFASVMTSSKAVFANVLPGDGTAGIKMGKDNPNFILAKITTSEKCDSCVIEVTSVTASATVKKFNEVPALPLSGPLRITYPKRYTAMLVRTEKKPLSAQSFGNNSGLVQIKVPLPRDMTAVTPWCLKGGSPPCMLAVNGQPQPSFFGFLNAVPFDMSMGSFGGVGGVASVLISGEATVVVRRDGNEVEKKKVTFDSGLLSVLDDATMPSWALDEARRMLTSGAPEIGY